VQITNGVIKCVGGQTRDLQRSLPINLFFDSGKTARVRKHFLVCLPREVEIGGPLHMAASIQLAYPLILQSSEEHAWPIVLSEVMTTTSHSLLRPFHCCDGNDIAEVDVPVKSLMMCCFAWRKEKN